ncbi:MAG: hypothetical protein HWD90_08810 [Campylobacteraceae bacterium]|nr:hypothetical protein [Campylobacteraceae bacterium]
MINHETNIDTVAIQINLRSSIEQRNKFDLLWNWIIGRRLGGLILNKKKSNSRLKVYDLMYGNRKLATLHTGFSYSRYYIRIRFAGLKSFNKKFDDASINALITICALLNTTKTPFRFVELDVAIDMYCDFHNLLITVPFTKRARNVPYNQLGFIQYFNTVPTSYIENYKDIEKRNNAFMRFYLYDKTAKEKLNGLTVTRAELKLQNRFFLRNGFNLDSIMKALNKYSVLYFQNPMQKQLEINKYTHMEVLNDSELNKLEYKYHRVYPNPYVIEDFIRKIQTTYVDFFGNVTVPPKLKNIDCKKKF